MLNYEVKGLDELQARFAKSPKLINREMRTTMRKSVDFTLHQVAGRTPVNTGQLRGSIAAEVHGKTFNVWGTVATPLIYGLPVEAGRTPGKAPPPTDAIELWVIRKGLEPPGKESRRAAFLIARAIGRRGIPAVRMFEKGLKASIPTINRLFEKMLDRITEKLAG